MMNCPRTNLCLFRQMRAILLLLAVVACHALPGVGPNILSKIKPAENGKIPNGCCLPSRTYQYDAFVTVACWDLHGANAGFKEIVAQADLNQQLFYTGQIQFDPTPKESGIQVWVTKGTAGTWQEFIKIHPSPDCFVATLTTQPEVFDPPCWQEPQWAYKGDITVGSNVNSVFEKTSFSYNLTAFIDPVQCIPTNELSWGLNDDKDWQEMQELFLNPSFTIKDPSKFTPPSGCKPLPPAELLQMKRQHKVMLV